MNKRGEIMNFLKKLFGNSTILAERLPPGKYFISHSYWDRVLQDGYTRPQKSTEVFALDGTQVELAYAVDDTKDPISAFEKQLSPHTVPFMFPPIDASPVEFVSTRLIEAILACDALIYLNEGHSRESFRVAFE